jgi:hypothetical protein
VAATDSRTAFDAHSTLRWRFFAIASMKDAIRFSAFWSAAEGLTSPSGSGAPPPIPTGCAAPMLEPGAIAATWPASVMKVPAEPAQAPCGAT